MGIILILAILVLRASCTEDSEENFNNSSNQNLSSEKGSVKHSETNNHPSQVEDNNSSGQDDSRKTDSRTATDEQQRANQNNSDSGKQAAQTSTDTDNSFQKHDNDNNSQEPSETNDETDDATIELDEDFDKMIDEFDFEVDEIDLEHIDLQANTIPPNAWLVIIDNVSELAEKYKDQMKHKDKERMKKDLARLKELEGILSERGQQEFGKEDPKEAEECATIELLILNTIRSMKPDDQISALDIDHDGVADFSI